jgi:hypothetical protein
MKTKKQKQRNNLNSIFCESWWNRGSWIMPIPPLQRAEPTLIRSAPVRNHNATLAAVMLSAIRGLFRAKRGRS